MKARLALAALLGLGMIVGSTGVALATGNHKEIICHPVAGKGETGYGYSIVDVSQKSKHFDQYGHPKHEAEGRVDVLVKGDQCPGAPVPTVTITATPTQTVTVTGSPTTITQTVGGPTSTVTSTGPAVTVTEEVDGPTSTVTNTGPAVTETVNLPGSTTTITSPGATSEVTVVGKDVVVTKHQAGKDVLAYTGWNAGMLWTGVALVLLALASYLFMALTGRLQRRT